MFAQACRSIGEPILNRPLAEISLANLLSQLFRVTKQFEMEIQPQLLLLQKTMLVAEGVGRQLDPTVNIWELAQPMIRDWMVKTQLPKIPLQSLSMELPELINRLPSLFKNLEIAIEHLAKKGITVEHEKELLKKKENKKRRRVKRILFSFIIILMLSGYYVMN
jgi:ubiquinone biosynthesis protein